ncbi:Gar/GrdA family gentamicin resistance ATP-binding protein [Pseudoxanthomonas beigongshangi]
MIIVLNGPLGIGKSTLAEALSERINRCAMLDGDALAAVNPPPVDAREHLHAAMALLVTHHRRFGYRNFVINHLWESEADLEDLRRRVAAPDERWSCYRLTLDRTANLARIARRAAARALDEGASEAWTFDQEYERLNHAAGDELGEPFDVSGPPGDLVEALLEKLR